MKVLERIDLKMIFFITHASDIVFTYYIYILNYIIYLNCVLRDIYE